MVMEKKLWFMVAGVILAQIALAINVSFSPDDFWFIPGQTKDYTLSLTNNYSTFDAIVYVKSLNTSFMKINNVDMLKIEIYNWGTGNTTQIQLNMTVSNETRPGDRDEFEVAIYNMTSVEELERHYYEAEIEYPNDINFTLTASKTNYSYVDINMTLSKGTPASELDQNKTKEWFTYWARIETANGTVLAENTSNTSRVALNLTGLLGRYKLSYGVNYSVYPRYNLNKFDYIYLLYSLNFTNVTASYLGPVNTYYPLNESVKTGTRVCIEGNIFYDNVIPLDEYPDYNLKMHLINDTWELEVSNGHFIKCFDTPDAQGNYSITLNATGKNGLKAEYHIPIEINNVINYKPTDTDVIAERLSAHVEGNNLIVDNENTFDINGRIYVNEESEYSHFNTSLINGDNVIIKGNNETTIPLKLLYPPWTPPGDYKLRITIVSQVGNITFPVIYKVNAKTQENAVTYGRYYETGENKTVVQIYLKNNYDTTANGTIIETIPKDVIQSLDFILPSEETKDLAKNCSKGNDTLSCIREVAIETGDCGICTTETCWEVCIQERLDSNKTFNKTYPIFFLKKPRIVKMDPEVSWEVNLAPGGEERIEYIINKVVNVSSFPELKATFKLLSSGNETETQNENNETNPPSINGTVVVYESKNSSSLGWFVGIALVLVLVIGGYFAYKKFGRKLKRKPSKEETKEEEKEIEEKPKAEEKQKKEKEPSPDDAFKQIGTGFV